MSAPVNFNVLLSADVDPRDKELAGSKISAIFGNTESMGTTTAEPQAVPEKKKRRSDGVVLVESEDEINASSSGLGSGEMKSCMLDERMKREQGKCEA